MKGNKTCNSLPDSQTARMGAHPKDQGKKRYGAKSNAQLLHIPRTRPCRAEEAIVLFTTVGHTGGKRSALVV